MKLLTKIIGKTPPREPAAANRTTVADPPALSSAVQPPQDAMPPPRIPGETPNLPPPLPCLLCGSPAIWSTIYEPTAFRCCDCEPPPGGWTRLAGGRKFVSRLLFLVIWDDVWQWENLDLDF